MRAQWNAMSVSLIFRWSGENVIDTRSTATARITRVRPVPSRTHILPSDSPSVDHPRPTNSHRPEATREARDLIDPAFRQYWGARPEHWRVQEKRFGRISRTKASSYCRRSRTDLRRRVAETRPRREKHDRGHMLVE